MSTEFPIRAVFERHGHTLFVRLPDHALDRHYTARPVRVRSASGVARSRILRRCNGEVVLVLGKGQAESLKLEPDAADADLWITVKAETLLLDPPQDLQEALRECGYEWNALPQRDRHMAISLIKEALTPELREARIRRFISSLEGGET